MDRKINLFLKYILSFGVAITVFIGSFSTAKAESITPGKTTQYGSYMTETFAKSTNDNPFSGWTLDLGFVEIQLDTANASCFHLHYDWDERFAGGITIQVNTSVQYKLEDCDFAVQGGYFSSIPSLTTSSSSKTFSIGIYQGESLDFYLVHKGVSVASIVFMTSVTYSIMYSLSANLSEYDLIDNIDTALLNCYETLGDIYDYMTIDMDYTFSQMLSQMQQSSNYIVDQLRYFPTYNTMGLLWGNTYGFQNLNYVEYPLVYIPSANNTGAYDANHRVPLYANKTTIMYLISYNTHTPTAGWHVYSSSGETLNVGRQQVNLPDALQNNGYVRQYLHILTVTSPTGTAQNFSFECDNNMYIFPLFIGVSDNVPDEIRQMAGQGFSNTYTTLLYQILEALNNLSGEDITDTSVYDDAVDDTSDFLTNVKNWIPSTIPFLGDIYSLPAFTGNGTHLDEVAGLVQDVYVGLNTNIPGFKTIVVLGLIVILMKVFIV